MGPGRYIQRRFEQINKAIRERGEGVQARRELWRRGRQGSTGHSRRCRYVGRGSSGAGDQREGIRGKRSWGWKREFSTLEGEEGRDLGRSPNKVRRKAADRGLLPQRALSLKTAGAASRVGRGQVASPGWGSPSSSWFCFSSLILCRQRRRNLMIFRAAWSCFLVRKELLLRGGRLPAGRRR